MFLQVVLSGVLNDWVSQDLAALLSDPARFATAIGALGLFVRNEFVVLFV